MVRRRTQPAEDFKRGLAAAYAKATGHAAEIDVCQAADGAGVTALS